MGNGELLKVIRKNKGLAQKDVTTRYIDRSAYSRLETGSRDMKLGELREILEKLSVNGSEFVPLTSIDKDQNYFREIYYYCAKHPNNKATKKKLLNYFEKLVKIGKMSYRQFCNYLSIKVYFQNHWEEIEGISDSEVMQVYNILSKKSYYYQYDYIMLTNLMLYFSKKQADLLIMKAIPIKDEEKRDYTTKNFAYNSILNLITIRIYDSDFESAEKYIKLAKKQDKNSRNYNYRINLEYLENLYKFLVSGEPVAYNNMLTLIETFKVIGDYEHSEQLNIELKMLTQHKVISNFKNGKPEFPVGIIKEG